MLTVSRVLLGRILTINYRVLHRFGQAKFTNGGSTLGSSQFTYTAPAAFKNDTHIKSGQN